MKFPSSVTPTACHLPPAPELFRCAPGEGLICQVGNLTYDVSGVLAPPTFVKRLINLHWWMFALLYEKGQAQGPAPTEFPLFLW